MVENPSDLTRDWETQSIAVIVPCYNEEDGIAKVVGDLRAALPTSAIYVYDNNSTDATASVAAEAGAIVRRELAKGKGNVVRRAFADIDADIYVMIDGDDTYEADDIPAMIDLLISGPYDHVLGVRQESREVSDAYRPGHAWGNKAFNALVGWCFGELVGDMLSGCRVFSRRFVKSFPALSREFEIETELTVHYSVLRIPHAEAPERFRERAEGSESKLHTVRDGIKSLRLLVNLVRHERPVLFYGIASLLLIVVALILGLPVVTSYISTGLVPRLPTAVLASSFVILAAVSAVLGLLLDGVTRLRRETARLSYLRLSAPEPHR